MIYRTIELTFWTDSKVVDDFTPEDKYFFLYLMTNPHTNIAGCYEISTKQIERETGYNEDTVKRLLNRMEHVHGVIRYSPSTKEILIINWHKYNWTKSDKLVKGIKAFIKNVKCEEFREYLSALVEGDDTVSIGYVYPMDTSVTVTNTNTVTNNNTNLTRSTTGKKAKFIPPTIEEVIAYFKEKKITGDPTRFYEYYSAGDWHDSKGNPVKNWKQKALAVWNKKEDKPSLDVKMTGSDDDIEDIDIDSIRDSLFG